MLRANGWGLAMVVVAGLLAGLGSLGLKLGDAPVLIGVGVSLVLMDGAVRLRGWSQPRWWLDRQAGGHIFYVPVWIIGLAVGLINLVRAVQV